MNEHFNLLVLFIAPIIGAAIALYSKPKNEEIYKLVLSFSGAFLFSVSIIHFFPVIFIESINAGIYVLIGFFIQLLLEQLTHGIEHGHFHKHHHHHNGSFLITLIIGLSVHSFFDGVPVLQLGESHNHANHSMLYAVAMHKIPEGYALAIMFLYAGYSNFKTLIALLLFALIAPSGTFFAEWLTNIDENYIKILFAIVGGSLLHVSTTILFESESGVHQFTYKKIIAVLLGGLIAILA